MRKIYIFGNGLGMSISPQSYSLPSVMSKIWEGNALDARQKDLIVSCLPDGALSPTSEDQLSKLQDTVTACDVLLSVREAKKGHWLTADGQLFPDAVRKFSYLVGREMHFAVYPDGHGEVGERCSLPDEFLAPLIRAVVRNQSHVATLNYDGLLSAALIKDGALYGNTATLLDGFVDSKFDRNNMFRKKGFGGWYMHLHGCPLFIEREKAKPQKMSELTMRRNSKTLSNVGRHLVLTHFKHKPALIEASEILSVYWEFLVRALKESDEILFFGYSGNDTHLNRMVSQLRSNKRVRVIEWLGTGSLAIRQSFWTDQFGGQVELELMEDVQMFSDW